MQLLERAEIRSSTGVAKDFRGRPGDRQVTVVTSRAWRDACAALGREVEWTLRRANLLVDGIDLPRSVGAVLCIGSAELLVTGETAPCSRMDEQSPGLTAALQPDWRGGVTCRVLRAGTVALGDRVSVRDIAG